VQCDDSHKACPNIFAKIIQDAFNAVCFSPRIGFLLPRALVGFDAWPNLTGVAWHWKKTLRNINLEIFLE
jgi:hypothetical protein